MISSLLLALALGYYTPQEAKAIFDQGNEAYARGEYAQAKEAYQKLLAKGLAGPDLYFNLGTTHLAAGEVGEGVLNLERAKRLAPPSETDDIEANLQAAAARQVDQVVGAALDTTFAERLANATHPESTGVMFLITWGFGFLLLAGRRLLRGGGRLFASVLAVLCLCAGGVSGAALASQVYVAEAVRHAVVLAPSAQVRPLPNDTAQVSFEIHAGLKVRLVQQVGGYVKVRLPNGLEGWTQAVAVEAI